MTTLGHDSPLQYVKGIGPVRAQWFTEAGLRTVGDLLEYYPFRHELEAGEAEIAELRPRMNATVRGTIARVRGGRRSSFTAEINDGSETCVLRWFHLPYSARQLYVGATVVASGTVQEYNDRLEIVQPRIQVFPPDAIVFPQQRGTRQLGVYRGSGPLKPSLIRRAVLTVLSQPRLPIDEFLPRPLLNRLPYSAMPT